eukprot:GHVU01167380.1.p1 GENE.GHVU01167380.1~~GHVU01167380.1.p1  ORF type:complete len:163 (-),score=26.46 GHVU01167380.1:6-494(-)
MSSTSHNTWTLFPSNEAASKTLEEHFNNNIAVEILRAENKDDVNTQLVDANNWAITFPPKLEQLVFPMELVFAIGTATPIKTHSQATLEVVKKSIEMMVGNGYPEPGMSIFDTVDESSEDMMSKAMECRAFYLLDTKSAATHWQFIETVLGNFYFLNLKQLL